MAKVKVQIRIGDRVRTYNVKCTGTNAEECTDDIANNDLLTDLAMEDVYFEFTVIDDESIFDEPEEEEEEEE